MDVASGMSFPADMCAVHHFVTRDDLTSLVGEPLRGRFAEIESREGEYCLGHDGREVVFRVRPDQPAIEMVKRLVHGVRARHVALPEIGILNRDSI